jgi:MFS family permease
VWLGGALASQLGDAVFYFALGWAASAHGGSAAGLVLSCIALPRTVLLILGGAVGDRWGPRRVMITGDAVMLVVSLVVATVAWRAGTPLALLVGAALIMGAVDAFYLPSAGSMPRRLVAEPDLPRALAMRQSGSQVITIAGGPLGGALVATAGFAVAGWIDAGTFAVVLIVLVAIRSRFPLSASARRSVLADIADGVRVTAKTPGLRAALSLVAAVAGFVIPVGSLLIPLLVRGHAWNAATAGVVIGSQGLGTIAAALTIARLGVAARAADVALLGLLTVAVGETTLAWSPDRAFAAVGALLVGAGTGIFVSHLAPVLLSTAPHTHLARVQSLLSIAQSAALLVMNTVLGLIAHATTARLTLLVCAGVLLTATFVAYRSPGIRAINKNP